MKGLSEAEVERLVYPHLDQHGYVCQQPQELGSHCANGNGNLDSAIFFLLCRAYHRTPPKLLQNFILAIKDSRIAPGLYLRGVHKWNDQISRDDYIGLLAFFRVYSQPRAMEIYNRGRSNWWTFQTAKPFEYRSWFGRYLDFRAHTVFSCDLDPSFLNRLLWAITMRISHEDSTDGITLDWIKYITARRDSNIVRWGMLHFVKRLRAAGGLRAIFERRYGVSHPITKIAPRRGAGRVSL